MSSLARRIGWRYVHSGSKRSFVTFISRVSMLGIALGVAVLIVVLSVMNGFEAELRQRILALASHATISGDQTNPLYTWRATRDTALQNPEVTAVAPFVEDKGMLVNGQNVSGVLVRGIVPELEQDVAQIASLSEASARLKAGDYGIVLGSRLAEALNVGVGDKVLLLISEARITPVGLIPRMRRFTVIGTFSVGMFEFDRGLAYVHMNDAQRIYRLDDNVSGLRLRLEDMFEAPRVSVDVARALGGQTYLVNDWTRTHANFFHSVRLTKSVLFFILLLIVAVAAFNIVSTLVLVVREKRTDIAILRTMGAPPTQVLRVFVVQGIAIGFIGTLGGIALGVALSYAVDPLLRALEWASGMLLLDPEVYLIDDLPARVDAKEVFFVAIIAMILSACSTVYPALTAARTQPAKALRHD
ncbi:MAG: lipoprotein-releasing ABC transporter permease subunit [Gammaproteobacteria bacterium]